MWLPHARLYRQGSEPAKQHTAAISAVANDNGRPEDDPVQIA